MSNGIMEKNLPVATELGEGDMVRIVTAEGNSKNIDASEIGGGGGALKVTVTVEEGDEGTTYTTDKTYNQIADAESLLFVMLEDGGYVPFTLLGYYGDGEEYHVALTNRSYDMFDFSAESADDVLVFFKTR